MKKYRWYAIAFIVLLVVVCLFPLYLQTELFREVYDRHLRIKYLGKLEEGSDYWMANAEGDEKRAMDKWLEHHDICSVANIVTNDVKKDICAVVTVTKGMEAGLGSKWTGKPSQIWEAPLDKIEVEVEEYLFDETGNYFDKLVIRDLNYESNSWILHAYTGERLILFIDVVGSGLCNTSNVWGFIIAEGDYLVPLTTLICPKMNAYGARKLDDYKKDIVAAREQFVLDRSFATAVVEGIMDFTGEKNENWPYCGYYVIEQEEDASGNVRAGLLFMKEFLSADEADFARDERIGLLEVLLAKTEMEYTLLSYQAAYLEEGDGFPDGFSLLTEEMLQETGYPAERLMEELRTSMGKVNHHADIYIQSRPVYERFRKNHKETR